MFNIHNELKETANREIPNGEGSAPERISVEEAQEIYQSILKLEDEKEGLTNNAQSSAFGSAAAAF